MNLDEVLKVAPVLVFSLLFLSIGVSVLLEFVNNSRNLRSAYLEKGILNILGDQTLVDKFFQHPAIQALCEHDKKTGKFKKPSYIPALKFAQAALDILVSTDDVVSDSKLSAKQIRSRLMTNANAAKLVDLILPNLENKLLTREYLIAYARINLEQQFDASMDRVTGWYKRNAQKLALEIGITLALVFSIDTTQIIQWTLNQPLQQGIQASLLAQMNSIASNQPTTQPSSGQDFASLYRQAITIQLPIGWGTQLSECKYVGLVPGQPTYPGFGTPNSGCQRFVYLPGMNDLWGWLGKVFGILISGIVAAQGAGYWFNALGKPLGLRASGPVPPPSQSQAPSQPRSQQRR